ncbi:ribosome hibernation-promoting factor, HPF/YfiA family [Roseomonas genomospecies 6]|uniref:Ribosome hibernation promoting factor n=1 Tax=Roseomonas genomospecies 6 TaxID=214106 RepID=A0A9W7NE20_9PROT|nr:ribosome-associated translation inhibitor RaiA [Roseomonas genomospecies 6]KAA0676565.1 ribosome-associated translation inhibitor RaiA [Roseomonas genomospecies 6]
MQLTVKGKQLDVGDALRTHVADSLNTVVGKYFNKPIEANVVLTREAHLFKADIQVHVGRGIVLQSASDATEPYPAFDTACEKLAKRLRRYKSRLRNHHTVDAAALEAVPARYQILEAEKDEAHVESEEAAAEAVQPMVIAEMETSIATLAVSEAVMRMELADAPALLFRNGAHGRLNLVYRRADGNIGWVDPAEKAGA